MLSPRATVLRGGHRTSVATEELLPGDAAGAPSARRADALRIRRLARDLRVDPLLRRHLRHVHMVADERGHLGETRTYAVNTLVVMEIFYLFSVRYLRAPSLTLQGLRGTRPVLIALTLVVAAQLMFTYAPFMGTFFDTRRVDFLHGADIIGIGIALFAILELEKSVRTWKARSSPRAPRRLSR